MSALEVVAGTLLLLLVFAAILGPPLFSSAASATNVANAMKGMSGRHLFGTDTLGRDVFARVMVAARPTLLMALAATLVGAVLGMLLGLATAAIRGRVSGLLTGLVGILVAFPPLLLAIFFAVVFGLGPRGVVLAVSAAFLPGFARLTETLSRSLAGRDYVAAARMLAIRPLTVARRHILPNIAEPVIVYFAVHVGIAILALSGLSFLGFGVQPPSYDWGSLLADGLPRIYLTPIAAVGPGAAILLAGLTMNLAGEAVAARTRLEPRSRGRRMAPPARDGGAPGAGPVAAGVVPAGVDAIRVSGLSVYVPGADGLDAAVRDVSFAVRRGEIVGIVGESGSGKSLTALAAARMLDDPLVSCAQQHLVLDQDMNGSRDGRQRREFLGTSLALVYQDPNATLNPALRLGGQITEVVRLYGGLGRRAAQDRAMTELGRVALPPDRTILRRYQHELSGGMKQRVSIATGLMTRPQLLIADEPTTALDVTVQAQIIRLLGRIREDQQTAIMLISHDIAVVTEICDRVLVMYAGHIVEEAAADLLARRPVHPYTRALLGSSLDIDTDIDRPLPVIPGRVPGPSDRTPGCRFAARCPRVIDRCRLEVPTLVPVADGQSAACWNPGTSADGASDRASVGVPR